MPGSLCLVYRTSRPSNNKMADAVEKIVLKSSYNVTWSKVHEIPIECTMEAFFDSANVWIDKPHVVNRRLSGSLMLKRVALSRKSCEDLTRFATESKRTSDDILSMIDECLKNEKVVDNSSAVEVILRRLLPRLMAKSDRLVEIVIVDATNKEISFIPVCTEKPQNSTDSNDKKHDTEMIPYKILYEEQMEKQKSIVLYVSTSTIQNSLADNVGGDGVVCPSIKWLRDQLLPKLKKWAENPAGSGQFKGSLRLISLEKYTILYQSLKEKYGWDLVKRWPENTDPQKFVFEDIAIATYLIILWEAEREKKNLTKKQSFIDLGCGNGLLVYILIKEGYPGSGVDVRKRKIWELYGPEVTLEENPLDPTASGLFPNVDWLIGNHSDELTPWLPVMAARSSYNTRYFVLPCCFYDFNCKYVRKDNKTSQYRGYLDFVNYVGVTCGFEVQEDALRIPSTKRVCLIGQTRTYPAENQQMMDEKIKAFIRERGCDIDKAQWSQTAKTVAESNSHDHKIHNETLQKRHHNVDSQVSPEYENRLESTEESCRDSSSKDDTTGSPPYKKQAMGCEAGTLSQTSTVFQPRGHAIAVRNCSRLSKSLREFIVDTVVQALLKEEETTDSEGNCAGENKEKTASCLSDNEQRVTSTGIPLATWRKGRIMSLADIAKLFDRDILKELKNECGGVQTLLRNNRYIFKVVGGTAQLRDWREEQPGPKLTNGDPEYLKRRYDALRNTSLCWFHFNHPDGCVLATEQCPYAHSHDTLVQRPSQEYLKFL